MRAAVASSPLSPCCRRAHSSLSHCDEERRVRVKERAAALYLQRSLPGTEQSRRCPTRLYRRRPRSLSLSLSLPATGAHTDHLPCWPYLPVPAENSEPTRPACDMPRIDIQAATHSESTATTESTASTCRKRPTRTANGCLPLRPCLFCSVLRCPVVMVVLLCQCTLHCLCPV